MNIENDIFKRSSVIKSRLTTYGFKKDKDTYYLEKKFLNDDFNAIIKIDNNGNVYGKIIDLQMEEEYIGLRTGITGEFVNKVRDEYEKILLDIKSNCFEANYFINKQTNRITKYIKNKYSIEPEFLWDKFKGYGVFRNKNNNKWFSIIMNIDLSKIDDGTGEVEIINLKLDEDKVSNLIKEKGYYKAYHMNKKDWISIILNESIDDKTIESLIDESYNLIDEAEEWIIPANPKYYDVMSVFNNTDEATWKQSNNIHINDIIYLYVAEPISKIVFKCKVIEVNIPFDYKDKNVSMTHIMKVKLLKKLDNKDYTFKYLNRLGIKAIRGPRKISKEISKHLK